MRRLVNQRLGLCSQSSACVTADIGDERLSAIAECTEEARIRVYRHGPVVGNADRRAIRIEPSGERPDRVDVESTSSKSISVQQSLNNDRGRHSGSLEAAMRCRWWWPCEAGGRVFDQPRRSRRSPTKSITAGDAARLKPQPRGCACKDLASRSTEL